MLRNPWLIGCKGSGDPSGEPREPVPGSPGGGVSIAMGAEAWLCPDGGEGSTGRAVRCSTASFSAAFGGRAWRDTLGEEDCPCLLPLRLRVTGAVYPGMTTVGGMVKLGGR